MLVLLRHSYHLLWTLHRANLSLSGRFSEPNFVVYYTGSNLDVRMVGPLHLVEFTKARADMDYRKLAACMDKFFAVRGAVPHHVRAWLDLIAQGYNGMEYATRYHTALMEPREVFTTTMALRRILERLRRTNSSQYSLIMYWLSGYDGWDPRRRCNNSHMDSSRRHTLRYGRFHHDVRGILKLARDCGAHPGKEMQELMLFIMEQDFPGLAANLHQAMFRGGQLPLLHLETKMA